MKKKNTSYEPTTFFFPSTLPTLRVWLPDTPSPVPLSKASSSTKPLLSILSYTSPRNLILCFLLDLLPPAGSSQAFLTFSLPSILNTCPYHLNRDSLITSVTFTILICHSSYYVIFPSLSSNIPIIHLSILISTLSRFASYFRLRCKVSDLYCATPATPFPASISPMQLISYYHPQPHIPPLG